MNISKLISLLVVTLIVFSLWVAFALLLINPYLHPYIPGYRVGKPCGWEFVALAISAVVACLWTRRWPDPKPVIEDGVTSVRVSYRFVVFMLFYLAGAVLVFSWRYMQFSAGFGA